MSDDLHNLDDALAFIDAKSVRTDQGSFLRVEDAKEVIQSVRDASVQHRATAPRPKTMAQAKRMAKADPELMAMFGDQNRPLPPGRAVPAMDPSAARA